MKWRTNFPYFLLQDLNYRKQVLSEEINDVEMEQDELSNLFSPTGGKGKVRLRPLSNETDSTWTDDFDDEQFRPRSQSDSRARTHQLRINVQKQSSENVNGSSLSPRGSGPSSPVDFTERRMLYSRGKPLANDPLYGRPRSGSESLGKKRGPVMNLVDKFRNRSSSDSRRRHNSSPVTGDQLLLVSVGIG